eukprot:365598-Chlamydomonas_euryale.AAC.13
MPLCSMAPCTLLHVVMPVASNISWQQGESPVQTLRDGSVVKQLLFAQGQMRLGGAVGRPRSTWRDRAVAALSPIITSRLAGWGGWGGAGLSAVAFPL